MKNISPGYTGIGIICSGTLYEPTPDGFKKNETFSRLKELRRLNYIISVQKCSEIIPEINDLPIEISQKLDEVVDKYHDFSAVNLDIGEQFLSEVLKRTKEILNHVQREDGNNLYEAFKVFYKFFAQEDGILQTNELCHMLGKYLISQLI